MDGVIRVKGGNPLVGDVTPIPNKNTIVATLPASILVKGDVVYHNVPKTLDVQKILKILKLLGADVSERENGTIIINSSNVNKYRIDFETGGKFRASIMFAGVLLARFKVAEVPIPGGCVLGRRAISAHIDSFRKVGVEAEFFDNYVRFIAPKKLKDKYTVWQLEASVTATENLLMYASATNACFEIIDAAAEPHVVDLENMLVRMGANIDGIGSNKLTISGSEALSETDLTPSPDFVDIAGYIVASAITKGKIRIKESNYPNIVGGLIEWFRMFNIKIEEDDKDLIVFVDGDLSIASSLQSFPMAGFGLPKLAPRPWPGFPVDVLPIMVTLASKTHGKLLIQNWMYESGLDFAREMNQIGANIFMADPQRIIVAGPVNFTGGDVFPPNIIQAYKALFLASLTDDVETTIHGVDILKRRYPDIFDVYKSIGANIEIL